MKSKVDVNGISASQVILDGLDDKFHQLIASTNQHRDEEIALQI